MNTTYHTKNVRHSGVGRFLIPLLLLAASTGCHRADQPVSLFGEAQGTYYSIQYFDPQHRNLQPQVDSLLQAFDQSASLWVDSSLIRRINAGLTDSLDPILYDLLWHSTEVFHYTQGAFNCFIGRIVQEWGFSFRQQQEPDSARLQRLLQAAHAPVYIDNHHQVVRTDSLTELDFNAIAQGYAADLVANYLCAQDIDNYLVDIGGEVVARGDKGHGKPWRVGIERPAANADDAPIVQTAIALRDASVVTSGSYRKYYERDGIRYSHTIDPATGRPVQHSLLSVSVVESEGWLADAMATAYMVMGLDSARAFIAAHPDGPGTQAVLFLYDSCGTIASYATPQWEVLKVKS